MFGEGLPLYKRGFLALLGSTASHFKVESGQEVGAVQTEQATCDPPSPAEWVARYLTVAEQQSWTAARQPTTRARRSWGRLGSG